MKNFASSERGRRGGEICFLGHDRATTKIYFCRLQVRLDQNMIMPLKVSLGQSTAIIGLLIRGQVRLDQPANFFYKANLT